MARESAGPRIDTAFRGAGAPLRPGGRCGCGTSFPALSSIPNGGSVSPGRLAGEAGLSGGRPPGPCAKAPARTAAKIKPLRVAIRVIAPWYLLLLFLSQARATNLRSPLAGLQVSIRLFSKAGHGDDELPSNERNTTKQMG